EAGRTGRRHRPGDAASPAAGRRRVTGAGARNREMGRAARRRYERDFSPAVGLERLLEGYRAAVAGRSGGGVGPLPGDGDTGSRRGHP
ncbi:glycosyltransferase family 1 protein, partial [Streptomyces pilosus]